MIRVWYVKTIIPIREAELYALNMSKTDDNFKEIYDDLVTLEVIKCNRYQSTGK